MMRNKNKFILTGLALMLIFTSFAYFTDVKDASTTAKAGDFFLDLTVEDGNFNRLKPGDARPITTVLTNKGNVNGVGRERLAIAIKLDGETLDSVPHYGLYAKADLIGYDEASGYSLVAGAKALDATVTSEIIEGVNYQVSHYTFEDFDLDSNVAHRNELVLIVDKNYTKTYDMAFEYLGEAKQASANPQWATIAQTSITFGHMDLNRVSGSDETFISKLVSYSSNGGETAPASQIKGSGELVLTSEIPTRVGHTFIGWNTSFDGKGETYMPGAIYALDNDLELFAQWEAKSYLVKFESSNGTAIPSQTVKYGDKVIAPSDPKQVGYHFAGWSKDLSEPITEDVTITANLKGVLEVVDGKLHGLNAYGKSLPNADDPIAVPDVYEGQVIKVLAENSSMSLANFPKFLEIIEQEAVFYEADHVYFPDTLKEIHDFNYITAREKVTFGQSITYLGSDIISIPHLGCESVIENSHWACNTKFKVYVDDDYTKAKHQMFISRFIYSESIPEVIFHGPRTLIKP